MVWWKSDEIREELKEGKMVGKRRERKEKGREREAEHGGEESEAGGIEGRWADEGEVRRKRGERRRREADGERRGDESMELRIVFSNITVLKNKDREFWENLREWEVIVLMETWTEERE